MGQGKEHAGRICGLEPVHFVTTATPHLGDPHGFSNAHAPKLVKEWIGKTIGKVEEEEEEEEEDGWMVQGTDE